MSRRSGKSASAFRTISEVADELDVQQHVLRFWETKFTQVKPLKRGGGRRYYRPEDVELLKTIHNLLYTEGYTIKGVQKLLKGQGKNQIIAGEYNTSHVTSDNTPANQSQAGAAAPQRTEQQQEAAVADADREDGKLSGRQKAILNAMLGDLKELRDAIKS
ncbi:MAG: MerR family transcriptional regulator [Alphaproteobacteria bacterium]|nr:MerR family transcriptional regulator [Alphaproteobacteria bacterium]MDP7222795.1 MerR family transcriptional regulator [Alphaproteobacteria bacterium]